MQVIKVVYEIGDKLVSTFAAGKWRKEYAKGVKTEPDVGYLFAYSSKNLQGARMTFGIGWQYWLAEAEVVGRICDNDIGVINERWLFFWEKFKLRLKVRGAEYLLCSSITLIRKLS